jgi:hypothetical protein
MKSPALVIYFRLLRPERCPAIDKSLANNCRRGGRHLVCRGAGRLARRKNRTSKNPVPFAWALRFMESPMFHPDLLTVHEPDRMFLSRRFVRPIPSGLCHPAQGCPSPRDYPGYSRPRSGQPQRGCAFAVFLDKWWWFMGSPVFPSDLLTALGRKLVGRAVLCAPSSKVVRLQARARCRAVAKRCGVR